MFIAIWMYELVSRREQKWQKIKLDIRARPIQRFKTKGTAVEVNVKIHWKPL